MSDTVVESGDSWLHELADVTDEVFWVSGPKGSRVHYVSPAFERLWGISRERIYAEPRAWLDAVHPGDVGRVRAATDAGATGEYEQEFRIVRPDGDVRWIMERGAPVRDDDGRVLRFAGTLRDISRRKQVEDALRESQRKFETLVSNMPGAAWRCHDDNDWTVEYMSDGARDVFGHPAESFQDGRVTLARVMHGDDIGFVRKTVEQSRASGRPYSVTYRIWRADGTVGWVREQARFVDDDMIEGVIVDLTELKRKELQLQGSVRALRMLSRCNRALIHAGSERELLETVCEVAVDDGDYTVAWIGRVQHNDGHRVTLVGASGDARRWPGEGALDWSMAAAEAGDPVARAAREGRPVFIADVSTLAGAQRAHYGVGSCICLPLLANDRPYGVFVLLRDAPSEPAEEEYSLLRELAANLEFGLQVRQVQEREGRLQRILGGVGAAVSARSSGEFFEQLVLEMTDALGADCGVIAKLVDDGEPRAVPVASAVGREIVAMPSYALQSKPCEAYLSQRECVCATEVAARFPDVQRLRELRAQGYVGHRLDSASGKPVGLLYVLYRNPVDEPEVVLSVLRLVATRAVAELERMNTEEHMRSLAYHDATTGLPNRVSCMAHLESTLGSASGNGAPAVLISLNLRRFKEVNDSLGHPAGDDLLTQVGRRLEAVMREGEFVARLGGDEFALVAKGADASDVPCLLERLQAEFRKPFRLADMGISMDVTAGVAVAPNDADTATKLVQHADIALHQAKNEGADHWCYDPALLDALNAQIRLARRLRSALKNDALDVYYQPQVDLRTGELIGAEALIRWHDPQEGWISPAHFLPVAQQRQMMGDVFEWVLGRVGRDLALWQSRGHRLPPELSVNVAAEQLHDDNLVHQIEAVSRNSGVPPETFAVEITETGIMRDPHKASLLVDRLRRLGTSVAIDDFGTGYSSLTYLKNLAADTLKIDLSFVRGMLSDPSDHAIVGTIVTMAHALGMNCIAEGVETEGHRQVLLEMGCEWGQGYLFDPARPADAFAAEWLQPTE